MDEILDVADAVVDSEFEGVIVWILRLIGVLALLAGVGLWLLTEMELLVLPLGLIVVGIILVVLPGILLTVFGALAE